MPYQLKTDTQNCKHCGLTFESRGLRTHQRHCKKRNISSKISLAYTSVAILFLFVVLRGH